MHPACNKYNTVILHLELNKELDEWHQKTSLSSGMEDETDKTATQETNKNLKSPTKNVHLLRLYLFYHLPLDLVVC